MSKNVDNQPLQDPQVQQPKQPVRQEPAPLVTPFSVKTNHELAILLGMKSPKLLTWLGKNKSEHYSKLYIRKKGSSKLRALHNPDSLIRTVQFRILKRVLGKYPIPEYIYAFEKNKSIPAMAANHVGKKIIVSLDIKDFFHSIKQNQLLAMLKDFGFDEKPARTLSELCTYKAFVPQGALTSPKVSNIIAAITFGPRIKEFCDNHKFTLSIYADDVTISYNEGLTPKEVIAFVETTISESGFRVNTKKTKVMTRSNRQYVCGVVVNEKTNLIREERARLRAIVHNISTNGLTPEAEKNDELPGHFAEVIMGKLNWLRQLNQPLGQKLVDKLNTALAKEKALEAEIPATVLQPALAGATSEDYPVPW